jgi:hypothetical protein
MKNLPTNANLVKIGQKFRAPYIEIYVHFTLAGDIKRSLRGKWYQAIRRARE